MVAARGEGVSKNTRDGYTQVQLFVYVLGKFCCVLYLEKLTVQGIAYMDENGV